MRKLLVDNRHNGKKLNKFILDSFSSLSPNMFFRALRQKDVKVNGVRIKDNIEVYKGDIVEIFISDELLFGVKIFNLEVVFEDENILAINKPINISVTDEDNNEYITLTQIVKDKFGSNLEPCHRLDRNTKRNCIIC